MAHLHEIILQYYPEYHTIERYPANFVAKVGKSSDEWGILGNMTKCTLIIDGVVFPSSEHLFQVMKFTDCEVRKELLSIPSAFAMKSFTVKKYTKQGLVREDWGCSIIDAMKYCLCEKYRQSAVFRQELQRTGKLFIIEDQTARKHGKDADSWGAVLSGDASEYVGPNLLGRLLMELRDLDGNLAYTLNPNFYDFSDLK